jgi:hypothetical protein
VRLSEELARILPGRRRRRPADQAPREIVPRDRGAAEAAADRNRFDVARERLRAEIPPRDDEDQ